MNQTRQVYVPGNGWRHLNGPVYERNDGLRLHLSGVCRTPSGEFITGMSFEEHANITRLIAINGGNRKRGLMVWANKKWQNIVGI